MARSTFFLKNKNFNCSVQAELLGEPGVPTDQKKIFAERL